MLCITYCQHLFKQRGRDAVLIPPFITTVERDETAYGKEKGKGTASHLPMGSSDPYGVVSTAEAAQQQQFLSSAENAKAQEAYSTVDYTKSRKK